MTEPFDPNPPAGPPPYTPPYVPPPYAPPYGPPAYLPPTYPPPGYSPAGYPPGFGYPGAGAYLPPYLVPGPLPQWRRPGPATAAGVVAFAQAGLLVAAGLLLLLGASFVNAVSTDLTSEDHQTVVWLALAGIVNVAIAGAAVAGGVLLMSRRTSGRWWLSAAALVDLVCAIVWLVNSSSTFVVALLLAGPLIVGAVLAWLTPVTRWLSTADSALGPSSTI